MADELRNELLDLFNPAGADWRSGTATPPAHGWETTPEARAPSVYPGLTGTLADYDKYHGNDPLDRVAAGDLLSSVYGPDPAQFNAFERLLASPGGNALMTLANFAPGLPGPKMVPKPAGIRAYHGSPHDFDRFDISKVGTGEGVQSYGHGLYFAENEVTARYYKDALSVPKHKVPSDDRVIIGPMRMSEHFDAMGMDAGPARGAVYQLAQMIERDGLTLKQALDRFDKGTPYRQRIVDYFAKHIEDPLAVRPQESNGRMYEVNINARPEQFLDLDKLLRGQSEAVRSIANKYGRTEDSATGADLLTRTGLGSNASAAFLESAIPGIRYRDAGSRGKEAGTSNYVVFDDKLIDILRKYGLAGGMAGAAGASGTQDATARGAP